VYPACPDEKISLFAFGGDVTGLFMEGLKYSVSDYTLSPFDPLCVSNECVEETACISFKTGLLMLYFSKD
jgi:thiamine pyrophosphokinase